MLQLQASSIVAAIWRQYMPVQLEQHLAGILNSTEKPAVYGSINTATTYKITKAAAYEGIIDSYSYMMKILLIADTAAAGIPPFLALGVTNIHLTDTQNAVENKALYGQPIDKKRNHLI